MTAQEQAYAALCDLIQLVAADACGKCVDTAPICEWYIVVAGIAWRLFCK